MSLNEEDCKIIEESLKIYSKIVLQQLPAQMAKPRITKIDSIIEKLKTLNEKVEEKCPQGITEEQFTNVCKYCEKFDNKCTDPIAKRYPGKCDPILHYEQSKTLMIKEIPPTQEL